MHRRRGRCALVGGPSKIADVMVQLANSEGVPVWLILGVYAEKRAHGAEAARASESKKWRRLTVSTVFEDTESLATKNSGLHRGRLLDARAIKPSLLESCGRIAGPWGAAEKLGMPRTTLESQIRALRIDQYKFKVAFTGFEAAPLVLKGPITAGLRSSATDLLPSARLRSA